MTKTIILLIIFVTAIPLANAKDYILHDKDEINIALKIYHDRKALGDKILPCIFSATDNNMTHKDKEKSCLCKHKDENNKLVLFIHKALDNNPHWLDYKYITIQTQTASAIRIKTKHLLELLEAPASCQTNKEHYSHGGMKGITKKLNKGKGDKKREINYVIENINQAKPSVLFVAANVAYKRKDITSAGYLYYAGRLRIAHDSHCYTPNEEHMKKTLGVLGIFRATLGAWIGRALKQLPYEKNEIIKKLKGLNIKVADNYSPDWKYSKKINWNMCKAHVEKSKDELINALEKL